MQFKKQFGQNFLRNDRFAHKLVEGIAPQPSDIVIEIGPGDGRVTNLLPQVVEKLIAVEIDYSLVPKLIAKFRDKPNFEIVNQDIMQLDIASVIPADKEYKLIGSLPYNISKQIIAKFLQLEHRPSRMSFIVQEEVAQEYVATAPKGSFLGSWVRLLADIKKLESIPRTQFVPTPKVNGAIITLIPHPQLDTQRIAQQTKMLRIAFSAPRKTLRNNLRNADTWSPETIDTIWETNKWAETLRPAELTTEMWETLYEMLYNSPVKNS